MLWAFLYIHLASAGPLEDCLKSLPGPRSVPVQYARGFSIHEGPGYALLTSLRPAQALPDQFYAVGSFPEKACPQAIRLPQGPKRVISLSTTHVAYLQLIDGTSTLVAHAYPESLSEQKMRSLPSVGFPVSPEKAVALAPDLVLGYVHESAWSEGVQKLWDLKLPVVLISEFREKGPLARAEWVKFIGALYGRLPKAISEFKSIEGRYLAAKERASKSAKRPRVLVGDADQGQWVVPGGDSDMAGLLVDAGAEYVFGQGESGGSQYLSWEKVLEKATQVDVWLSHNYWRDLGDAASKDSRYKLIKAFQDGRVWNNDVGASPGGRHPFWENSGARPDLWLQDLVELLHGKGKNLSWYRPLLAAKGAP